MNPDDLSWMYGPAIRPSAWHIQRRKRLVRRATLLIAAVLLIGAALGALW